MRELTNPAASVKARLRHLSQANGTTFQRLLGRYAMERLLYRLGCSDDRERFVLKGALLFLLWDDVPNRATRDIDLLGRGANSAEALLAVFQSLCRLEVEADGIKFDPASVTVAAIRADQEYQGQRVRLRAYLERTEVSVQVDVGFGDSVVPPPQEVVFPVLLDQPAPRLRAYPREAVVAEKFQAMVELGASNSRMKDFFDIWVLAQQTAFEGQLLAAALRATFARRGTPLPTGTPAGLEPPGPAWEAQWAGFLSRLGREHAASPLPEVVALLQEFLLPPALVVAQGQPFDRTWVPGGPWAQVPGVLLSDQSHAPK